MWLSSSNWSRLVRIIPRPSRAYRLTAGGLWPNTIARDLSRGNFLLSSTVEVTFYFPPRTSGNEAAARLVASNVMFDESHKPTDKLTTLGVGDDKGMSTLIPKIK